MKSKEAEILIRAPHLLCIHSSWMCQRASNADPQRCSTENKSVLSTANDSLSIIHNIKQRGKSSRGGWGRMVLTESWRANRTCHAFISIPFLLGMVVRWAEGLFWRQCCSQSLPPTCRVMQSIKELIFLLFIITLLGLLVFSIPQICPVSAPPRTSIHLGYACYYFSVFITMCMGQTLTDN